MSKDKLKVQQESLDALELLHENCIAGIVISLAIAFIIVLGFGSGELQKYRYIWLTVITTILLLRLADTIYWQIKLKDNVYNYKRAIMRFNTGIIITALCWSFYIIMITEKSDIFELSLVIIFTSSLAGASATILSGSKIAAMSYSGLLLFPMSIYFVTLEETMLNLLGIMCIVYGILMVASAKKSAEFTLNGIRLRHHNEDLIEKMEEKVVKRTEKIYELSNLDPLTGLLNRNAFTQLTKKFLSEPEYKRVAILFIDLDGFKQVNDSLGHEIGDEVLKIITKRILKFKLEGDVSRWGGDEFVLALPNYNGEKAYKVAQDIISAINQTIVIGSLKLNIGSSIGISLSPEHSVLESELVQFADIAMYKQKNSEDNSPKIFSNELYLELKRKEDLREGLRTAIKNSELHLEYQPVYNASDKAINCTEALLRWNFKGESISPVEFIEICEQSGLIIEIGQWVLEQACFDAMNWQSISQTKVCINVSVVQLLDDGFLEKLDAILAATKLPPEKLILEVTESTFAENKEFIHDLVNDIKSRKIGVSIDDFGTGYSSMSQLQTLTFDIIKIDRSFVNNIDGKGKAIINATLYIAKELGCKTIAEGVETESQANTLEKLGADYLQGYFYSRPVKYPELLEAMKKHKIYK